MLPTEPNASVRPGRRVGGLQLLTLAMMVLLIGQRWMVGWFDGRPAVQTFATIFVSICIQASPFLVLGVVLSAFLSAVVPASFFSRVMPTRLSLAVPAAASAGMLLPGCECASVPVAASLVTRGLAPSAAFAFLLAAPAINPVVLAATAVAFPDHPTMVLGRLLASLMTACVMGWLWARFGRPEWLQMPHRPSTEGKPRHEVFRAVAQHDFLQAGGFLVVGALTAAVLHLAVPTSWQDQLASMPVISSLALAVLAVLMAICSEADAFIAATLTQFSLVSRLVFLVVGPMIDVKLFALQVGTFGRRFALRFGPTTFAVAVSTALVVGWGLW